MHSYRSNQTVQQSPRLQWFSRGQLEEIHSATIEVLERVGVRVDHDEALALLKDAGCIVKDRVAFIPGWLVEECIRLAPSKIRVCNRQGQPALSLSNRTYFGTGSDLPFQLTWKQREAPSLKRHCPCSQAHRRPAPVRFCHELRHSLRCARRQG